MEMNAFKDWVKNCGAIGQESNFKGTENLEWESGVNQKIEAKIILAE